MSHGITIYDSNTLNDVFRSCKKSWYNTLCPMIFTIQAVILLDATVFKFTMQHAAGDAVGECLQIFISQCVIADIRFELCTMRPPHSAKDSMTKFRNAQSRQTGNTELPVTTLSLRPEGSRSARLFEQNKLAIGGTCARETSSSQR
jgi:hypothetical protein